MTHPPLPARAVLLERFSAASPNGPARSRLLQRLGSLAGLLAVEWIAVSYAFNSRWGARTVFMCAVTFACIFLGLGSLKSKSAIQRISHQLGETPISWKLLIAHFGAMLAFWALSLMSLASTASPRAVALVGGSWFLAAGAGMVLAAVAFVPLRLWYEFGRGAGYVWILAAGGTFIAWKLVLPAEMLWGNSLWKLPTDLTFRLVHFLLQPFLSGLVSDPATRVIGNQNFQVTVEYMCSGLEGAALMLVFSVGWLWFCRRECRFPQALLLIPGSVLVVWLLNSVRIAGLVLLGAAGGASVAVNGAHSQAGWILFNGVALGVCWAAGRVSWWSARERVRLPARTTAENPTASYLMPFIMILVAATISRTATGNFEWLYPLRFFAAAGALWFFRSRYRELDWRAGWLAPVVGAAVFVIWIAAERGGGQATNGIAAAMGSLPSFARISWLSFRTLGAVITVPIAEELAFRGFLIRRLISPDFEKLDFRRFTWLSVVISSLVFGAMHGERWLVGSIAGLLYAWVYLRRGRIGDAIVAHATSNALIAAAVLIAGKWFLW
jgi:exosortase E/protease (VPEID-CTERM system)